jgi:predicted PurR-regulated permease PerM
LSETHERPVHHRSDIIFFFVMAILLAVAYRVRNVLLVVYLAALFAVVLAPAIDAIRRLHIGKFRLGRGLALITLILGVLGALTLFFTLAVPPIVHDAQELARNWPDKVTAVKSRMGNVPFVSQIDVSSVQSYAGRVLGGAVGIVQNVAGGLFTIFTWIILTSYFILDGERAFHWVLSMFERQKRDRLERTMLRAEVRMRNWLVGQAGLMFILGVTSAVVFGLMGLKYFYALAVITGLLNIVPIIGPVIALSLAGVVALVDSPLKMLGVVGFFIIYQQLETAFLTPRIMKHTVDLPALAVIIALSLGGAIAGMVGALVAVPTAAMCAVLIDEYLVKPDARSGAAA